MLRDGAMLKRKKFKLIILVIFIMLSIIVTYYESELEESFKKINPPIYNVYNIPKYNGRNYIVLNNNIPNFDFNKSFIESFEIYSELDSLGRSGVAFVNVGIDIMPKEERTSIGGIKPSGWHTIKYDIVSGKYLYNRCHLIGYQLTGENANEKNLITCTRNMNTVGMLYFENKVAEYIKNSNNHVLYRATPIYDENNLIASGVQLEAYSIEDKGNGIMFNVFVYNVQDGVIIDYKTGNSMLESQYNK